jgi:VWFA-related protein
MRRILWGSVTLILVLGVYWSDGLSRARVVGLGPTGQSSKAPASESGKSPDDIFRIQVNLVNLLCTVTDKSGRFLTALNKEDFTIYEDGKPQEVRNFLREVNLPLKIALLIDVSESVMSKLKFEQEAATRFLYSILRDKDRALLVEFDSGVTLLQDFTNNVNKLAKQIKTVRAGGGTSLNDAIYHVCEQKLLEEKGRKAIILISDGSDTTSQYSFDAALEMAHRAEVTVFAISTNKTEYFGLGINKGGDRVLTQLTEETGGQVFFPSKLDDLDEAFKRITDALRSQYSIGYVSSNPKKDGRYRTITVKPADKGLRVRHRKGYYAPTG